MAYDNTFNALADKTRRAILERIARSPCSVGEITQTLTVSQPAVSQHLRVLKEAGLVRMEKDGVRRIYRIAPEGLKEARSYFDQFWTDALEAFHEAAHKQSGTDENKGGKQWKKMK